MSATTEISDAMLSRRVDPASSLEAELVRMWEDLLGISPIGVETNFFDAGGSSRMLKELLVRLNHRFHSEWTTTDLFRFPTIRSFAEYLGEGPTASTTSADTRSNGDRRRAALGRKTRARR